MNRDEIFVAWAPDLPEDQHGMPWTSWAKPVLFATLGTPGTDRPSSPAIEQAPPISDSSWSRDRMAVVVDLPGPEAVQCGMQFAELGFRPVPLFNGSPGPGEVVATWDTCRSLEDSAARLRELQIDVDASPVFLLDSRRMSPSVALRPGLFDNRWLTFPQDFPSANLLLARGIAKVLLVQSKSGQPQDDLAHVLRRWQEAGIGITAASATNLTESDELEVNRPPRFRSVWHRLRAMMGLFPNSTGGFGAVIPQPSSG